MKQVVTRLKEIIKSTNNRMKESSPRSNFGDISANFYGKLSWVVQSLYKMYHNELEELEESLETSNELPTNSHTSISSCSNSSLHGELSQLIQDFNKMNTKELAESFEMISNEIIHISQEESPP